MQTYRQFTLIELLTVVAIIAMLVGITVPIYNRLMTGNAVSYANRIITSQLNMARTYACSRRVDVAVIFLDHAITYNAVLDDPVALRTYRTAIVRLNGSTWEFVKWVPGTNWQYLPSKAAFAINTSVLGEGDKLEITALVDDVNGLIPSLPNDKSIAGVEDDNKDSKTKLFADKINVHSAIIFRSDGRPVCEARTLAAVGTIPVGTTLSPCVQVREATIVENANNATMAVGTNSDNYMYAVVNRYTGAVSTKQPE